MPFWMDNRFCWLACRALHTPTLTVNRQLNHFFERFRAWEVPGTGQYDIDLTQSGIYTLK